MTRIFYIGKEDNIKVEGINYPSCKILTAIERSELVYNGEIHDDFHAEAWILDWILPVAAEGEVIAVLNLVNRDLEHRLIHQLQQAGVLCKFIMGDKLHDYSVMF